MGEVVIISSVHGKNFSRSFPWPPSQISLQLCLYRVSQVRKNTPEWFDSMFCSPKQNLVCSWLMVKYTTAFNETRLVWWYPLIVMVRRWLHGAGSQILNVSIYKGNQGWLRISALTDSGEALSCLFGTELVRNECDLWRPVPISVIRKEAKRLNGSQRHVQKMESRCYI